MIAEAVGHLNAGLSRWRGLSPVSQFRIVLCVLAGGLVSWVVALATEQPWAMETGDRKNWKLEQIVRYYSFWAALGNLIAVAA
ncbi:MAG TPA: hypothetical protein VIS99_04565, partial [Terrimicrobiaceae bacterium]